MTTIQKISSTDFTQKLSSNNNVCILDVRTHAEVNSEFLESSICLPLQDLTVETFNAAIGDIPASDAVYILCGSGARAQKAADLLIAQAKRPIVVIEGGINAMKHAGAAVKKGNSNMMSLERQVRIAAGGLVFSGVVLGTYVNSGFYGLSAFVGAGLMFAGITDTCAMGMMIARMPWNKA